MEAMEELTLRRQAQEALDHALSNPAKAAIARIAFQMVINGQTEVEVRESIGKKKHAPKVDLAEERRASTEANLRKRGHAVTVPKPDASNRDFAAWKRAGMGLFYHAPNAEVSYEAWMSSHGQANHWTVTNEVERAKIIWERTIVGHWFLAETALACPRVKTSWNDLTAPASRIRLLSLEEYVIVYWTHRDLTGERIDMSTLCWLRTRYGLGALSASDYGGVVGVNRNDAGDLAIPYDCEGGRAVEVVKSAA